MILSLQKIVLWTFIQVKKNTKYEKKERVKMLTKGFELGTSGSKGQCPTSELDIWYEYRDTNFYITIGIGVCDHHTPLSKIVWKIP